MQNDKLSVALIGYGFGGKTFHAPLITHVPGLQLTHVVSSDPGKVKKDLADVTVLPNAGEAFSNPNVDLIVIVTPNDLHFDQARQALLAGKHVVVDKPFTETAAQAAELTELAGREKKVLSVFQNRRWDSDFLTLREIIRQDSLGEILQFDSHFDRYRPDLRQPWKETPGPSSGLWYDLGPHLGDQALQLFGTPEAVYADFAFQRKGTQIVDYFHVVLRYGQRRAILHGTSFGSGRALRYWVNGRKGSFVKHGLDPQEDALRAGGVPGSAGWGDDPDPGTLVEVANGSEIQSSPSVPGNYLGFYEGIRDAILRGSPNPVPPEQGLAVMRLLEFAVQSAEERREIRI